MSRRRGSGRGFIGRLDWSGWLCLRLHIGFVVGNKRRLLKIDARKRLPQPLVLGLALLVGRCRLLGAVYQIEEPQPGERHRVSQVVNNFPEQARKGG
jgi:hypothetical protein